MGSETVGFLFRGFAGVRLRGVGESPGRRLLCWKYQVSNETASFMSQQVPTVLEVSSSYMLHVPNDGISCLMSHHAVTV
jgi:hypothetical protein